MRSDTIISYSSYFSYNFYFSISNFFFVTNCTNYYNYIVLFKKLEIRILLYDFYASINEKIYQYCKMYLFLLNNFYLKYFVSFIFFKIFK